MTKALVVVVFDDDRVDELKLPPEAVYCAIRLEDDWATNRKLCDVVWYEVRQQIEGDCGGGTRAELAKMEAAFRAKFGDLL